MTRWAAHCLSIPTLLSIPPSGQTQNSPGEHWPHDYGSKYLVPFTAEATTEGQLGRRRCLESGPLGRQYSGSAVPFAALALSKSLHLLCSLFFQLACVEVLLST